MIVNVVLVEPEIPQNTGNIARTCAVTGASLHLIRPLGFSTSDKYLKRAGLDYWDKLDITYYDNLDDFFEKNQGGRFFFVTTKAPKSYHEFKYKKDDFFLFGKETAGLDNKLLKNNLNKCIRIPMKQNLRSLNLANSVSIIIYEALRQNNFSGLEKSGLLKKEF
ncbi:MULTISPECIES: tRNA (uridine(34)/cytosine(34)/5-carboxymethylaminomethyluridine(34)-2'-O)-methyltransferase TrmL [unclassified Halanaerobium]|uniref:tRNA (uridine(34)/cytosine(34)/5- carboxymethylaminomethyluridine(34)-2'-O)- methyltransferase TrmL n=1 Tax=unclassified Halanaerobium TaxID=2641197 RepID=UPI000DF38921|nr:MULTISPECIES: tRNA (uridine(34)/cytosine(34)/5-carboxymethylaminomethyluridine(34)-2'-O)-methyltransferase TrmL [unclassified Halanaerobium]